MASNDDGSPPPVLTIDLDEEDDGFPTTPPILEREEYVDETVKAEAAPQLHVERGDGEVEGERDYETESDFPLPKKLRSFDPQDYYRHSNVFLFEVVCILCQRACNDAHVVLCGQYHRFCKSCIMPRWEGKIMKCPRCNGNVADAPQPDPVFDNIIRVLRYDRNKVNYLHVEVEESSGGEESASDESDVDDHRNGTCSGFASGEESMEEKDVKTGPGFYPPKERWTNTAYPDENWLIRRYKRRHNQRVRGSTPPYRFPPSSPNARVIPVQWHLDRRRKPLEGMMYKNFECNSGHEWPANVPPPPPYGMSPLYFKNIPAIQKIKEEHMNMDYLSKREKKILVHQKIAKLCSPEVIEQFESSSDDDEPPRKFRKTKFEYPSNYRKPRKNWRDDFNSDGTRKARKPIDVKAFIQKMRKKHKWNKDWGNPLMLLRENSSESSFPARIFSRIYIATTDDTTIAHLRVYVYNKIAGHLKLSSENVTQLYQVDFYAVLKAIPGKKVNIIKCDENIGKASAGTSPSKQGFSTPYSSHSTVFPFCGPSTSGSQVKRFNGSPTSVPFKTVHIDGKKIIFPFGRKEPTVREFALKTMSLKDDRVMASKRRMMMAPPFPDHTLRIENVSPNVQTVQAVTPPVQPPPQFVPQQPSDGMKELQPLFPVQRIPGPSTQPPQLPRIEPRPVMPKPSDDVLQLVQTVDPTTKQQRLVALSPQRPFVSGAQPIAVSPTKRPGVASPPQNTLLLPPPRRLPVPAQGQQQTTVQTPQPIAVQGTQRITMQSPQPVVAQSPSSSVLQSPEQQKGTAQGFSLDKPCTVYSTRYPLRSLEESLSCGDLRKRSRIYGGARLVLFFSIKDRMPVLNPVVGPSRP